MGLVGCVYVREVRDNVLKAYYSVLVEGIEIASVVCSDCQ